MGFIASARSIPVRILEVLRHRSNDNRSSALFSALYGTGSRPVPSEISPLTDFLLKECGFSAEDVNHVCKRRPDLLNQKSRENLEQTLVFFKQRGFSETNIRKLLVKCPNIMCLDFQVILKPKLELLDKIGLTGHKLLKILTENPTLLNRDLIPKISYLQSVLDPKPDDRGSNPGSVEHPETFEAEGRRTAYIICKHPRILGRSVTTTLARLVKSVEGLGIEKGSKMFGHALIMFSRMSEETVKRKMQNLMELGFSEEEVGMLVRRMPPILEVSEGRLRETMKFLVEEWKLPRDVIAKSPALLQYSLEKRLRPRLKVLDSLALGRVVPKKGYFSPAFISMPDDVFCRKVGIGPPVVMEGEDES